MMHNGVVGFRRTREMRCDVKQNTRRDMGDKECGGRYCTWARDPRGVGVGSGA